MKFPLFIALRYLISKKKQNIINLISGVAVAGVTIGTVALIVVLSVYNGFDSLIRSMFNSFDPDIQITAVKNKSFNPSEINLEALEKTQGVLYLSQVFEESAILKNGSSMGLVTIKGVSSNYNNITDLNSLIYGGSAVFEQDGIPYAVVGLGVANNLGIQLNSDEPLDIYAAKKGERISPNIMRSLNHNYIYPSGIFCVQESYDSRYVIVPLSFARELFETPENVTSIELKLAEGANQEKIQGDISQIAGKGFHVKNKFQQQEIVYKVMNSEQWAIYFILVFILLIASFNILGSITMLIIDKRDDIFTLRSLGADQSLIRRIFLYEGWLISISGAFGGIILGSLVCWLQIRFQLLKFPGNGSFAVPAYPVEIHFFDLILTFLTVLLIGFVVSWLPVRFISGKYITATTEK